MKRNSNDIAEGPTLIARGLFAFSFVALFAYGALTAASWLFFFGLFDYGLQLPFPNGAIFDWAPANFAALHPIS